MYIECAAEEKWAVNSPHTKTVNTTTPYKTNKLVSARLTSHGIFSAPLAGPWSDCYQNARRCVGDRPSSLCKISTKCVQQFWRRCVPNRQTHLTSHPHYHEGENECGQTAKPSTTPYCRVLPNGEFNSSRESQLQSDTLLMRSSRRLKHFGLHFITAFISLVALLGSI